MEAVCLSLLLIGSFVFGYFVIKWAERCFGNGRRR